MTGMAFVPVAFLYLLLGIAVVSLLVAPVMTVWRAFWVRPLQRKFRKIQGKRSSMPKEAANSPLFKFMKEQEEILQNTRTLGFISLATVILALESPVLLRGYKFPGWPVNLDGVNKVFVSLATHVAATFAQVGPVWAGIGVAAAIVGGFVAGTLLDLLGEALGTPVRAARDALEASLQKARKELEEAELAAKKAAEGPAIADITHYYMELDIPTTAGIRQISGLLGAQQATWERREKMGDPEKAEKARQILHLIEEAREILLDADKKLEYDKKIGLRGEGATVPGGSKGGMMNSREIKADTLAQIEEIKKKRKQAKQSQ